MPMTFPGMSMMMAMTATGTCLNMAVPATLAMTMTAAVTVEGLMASLPLLCVLGLPAMMTRIFGLCGHTPGGSRDGYHYGENFRNER